MQSCICCGELPYFTCSVSLSLRGVLTSVSCPIVLSTYGSTSYCLKQFCKSVSVFCFFTAHVVLAVDYDLFVESERKNGHQEVYEKKKHFGQPKCRKHFKHKIGNLGSVSTN